MESDLTTAATVADALGVTSGTKVDRAVSVASDAIAKFIGRRLHYGPSISEKLAGYVDQVRLVLSVRPVISVASVVLPGNVTLGADAYELENLELGWLYRASGWPYTGLIRAGLLYDTPAVGTEREAIVATYAGGWVTPAQAASPGWAGPARSLPYDIEEACIQTAVGVYRGLGNDKSIASESLGDYSVSYRNPNSLIGVGGGGVIPDGVMPQLAAYRSLV